MLIYCIMVQELSTLIVSLHNIIEKPKAGNPGFVASKNSSKANVYMLVLCRQSIRRRGIRVSSKEYENLVTLRKALCHVLRAMRCTPCHEALATFRWQRRKMPQSCDCSLLLLSVISPESHYLFSSMFLSLDP